jgi:hypothetical protein
VSNKGASKGCVMRRRKAATAESRLESSASGCALRGVAWRLVGIRRCRLTLESQSPNMAFRGALRPPTPGVWGRRFVLPCIEAGNCLRDSMGGGGGGDRRAAAA